MSIANHHITVTRSTAPPHLVETLSGHGGLAMAVIAALPPGPSPWIVGGAVRDALLGLPVRDVDLVVEADARVVARRAAELLGCRVHTDDRFLTAWLRRGREHVDIVTARRERYPRPGVLPLVEPSTLDDDLVRRDFTINALALDVDSQQLAAPLGAPGDIAGRLLRVFHPRSFADDPTRLLRLARYAASLGLAVAADTLALVPTGLPVLATISPVRVRRELQRIVESPARHRIWALLDAWGVAAVLGVPAGSRPFDTSASDDPGAETAWLALMEAGLAQRYVPSAVQRLRQAVVAARRAGTSIARLAELDPAALAAAARFEPGEAGAAARQVQARLSRWPTLSGEAVMEQLELGPGPVVGAALRELRRAIADGEVSSQEEQRQWLDRWATIHLRRISRTP